MYPSQLEWRKKRFWSPLEESLSWVLAGQAKAGMTALVSPQGRGLRPAGGGGWSPLPKALPAIPVVSAFAGILKSPLGYDFRKQNISNLKKIYF